MTWLALGARLLLVWLAVVWLVGCVANPVTGKKELRLVSESQEIRLGKAHYLTSQQMQGGLYNADPELASYVQEVGQKLARVSDRDLPYEFVLLNNSIPNAWALPGGKIAVNRGLLTELNDEAELAAVLGHEIVHAAARHGAKSVERGILLQGAIITTGVVARDNDYAGLIGGGAQLAAGLIMQRYGRDAERESDYYGMQYMSRAGYDPQAAVSLQEVFVRLSADRSSNWLSGLFASHPPSAERVENNKRTAAGLPAGGTRQRERYQQKIAALKRTEAAYKGHDEGRRALAKGHAQKAIAWAQEAIQIEPREAQFHALLGDALYEQQRYREALSHYDHAIARQGAFFHYYIQRGLTHQHLGNSQAARADLDRSMQLLPTATAANTLGRFALDAGDREQALRYFRVAAGFDSPAGREAAASLVQLDLPRNPNAYLQTRVQLDRAGYVLAQVINPTPVAVHNVRVIVQYRDARGVVRQTARMIHQVIRANDTVVINTGLGPVQSQEVLQSIRVGVDRASVLQ